MLPWNYGFHWTTGTIVFMGAFYCVLSIVAVTVLRAILRSRRAIETGKTEHIRWHSDFHDLTPRDRVCRHVLTGEFRERECHNSFDCRVCETHAKLAHRIAPAERGPEEVCGMPFPANRYYHRGHTWAQPQPDGTMTVGIDELGRRLVGSSEAVGLPAPGTHIHANGTAFRVRRRGAEVRLLSPLDGEVVETGGADRGWYLKMKPVGGGHFDVRHLLSGREVGPWVMREMERLELSLTSGNTAPTLADGGVLVEDIAEACPEADWDAVCGHMFLEP